MKIGLPMMRCDSGCGACCGPVVATEKEFAAVASHARQHGIEPADQGSTCPWYQGGQCQVYEVRPFVCQMFGHSDRLVCCKGYNADIPERDEKMLVRRLVQLEGKPRRMLHEIIPGWAARMQTAAGPVSLEVTHG
jgi:Fe-S-cluster containining protein